jgi:hypothetical protein
MPAGLPTEHSARRLAVRGFSSAGIASGGAYAGFPDAA